MRLKGEILKIEIFEKLIDYNNERVLVKFKEYAGSNTYSLKEIEEWEHSPNIIDLIEVGDRVNGYSIIELHKDPFNGKMIASTDVMKIDCWGDRYLVQFHEEDVESVVTHEQFESISYEVK